MDFIHGPIPTIIDTDPGQDDAIAILFAFGATDRLKILALTAVAGNVPVELTSRNARIIRDWAGHTETPVYAGCHRPLARTLITAEEVHGDCGLHGVELPEPRASLASGSAVNFLVEILSAATPHSLRSAALDPSRMSRRHSFRRLESKQRSYKSSGWEVDIFSMFRGEQVNVSVETCSELTLGETVVDWYGVTGRKPNALWINQVDVEGVFELLISKIKNLP
jgi:inosine-uridine nucleoside N-ribohydrolase